MATAAGVLLLLFGWGVILHVNRWYFTAPVFFLWVGWLGVLLTARYLWQAGWSAASDTMTDEEFWKPPSKRDELEREKKSLLKAIKEIEFDHQMGKMSVRDAEELTRFYRSRAIEVIKVLESGDGDGDGDGRGGIDEEIERDMKARMKVVRAPKKGARGKKTNKAESADGQKSGGAKGSDKKSSEKGEAGAEAGSEAEAEAEAEAGSEAEAETETETETGAETGSETGAEAETESDKTSKVKTGSEDAGKGAR